MAAITARDYFNKNATVLYDTREKENFEYLKALKHMGLIIERTTFKSGDYSFRIDGKDYRNEWLGERKGSMSELYGNVMAKNKDKASAERNNLEEECKRVKDAGVKEFVLFIEGTRSLYEARHTRLSAASVRGNDSGRHIYSTLLSWACNNRYGFKTVCNLSQYDLAVEMADMMYYYWRNEMIAAHGKDFIKKITENRNGQSERI